jgi:hypothetical protein
MCPSKIFKQGNSSFLVKVYKALFNLILKYGAEIQLPGSGIQLLFITQSSGESFGILGRMNFADFPCSDCFPELIVHLFAGFSRQKLADF